jgi:hypothetical protein
MRERLEDEYKSKAVRLKTAIKYKGGHDGSLLQKNINPKLKG